MEIPLLSFFFSCFVFCGLGTMAYEPRKFIHCLLLLCISLMVIFISMVIYQHVASVSSYWSPHQKVSGNLEFCFREKTKRFGPGISISEPGRWIGFYPCNWHFSQAACSGVYFLRLHPFQMSLLFFLDRFRCRASHLMLGCWYVALVYCTIGSKIIKIIKNGHN